MMMPPASSAQSLGEVAQREAERRQATAKGKVYTNADLDATAPQPQATAPAAPPATTAPDEVTTPKKVVTKLSSGATIESDPATGTENIVAPPARNKRDEKYWRDRAKSVRGRLAKASTDLAATKAHIADLDTREPSGEVSKERDITLKLLARLQIEFDSANQDVAKMNTAAEFAKVPPDWIQ